MGEGMGASTDGLGLERRRRDDDGHAHAEASRTFHDLEREEAPPRACRGGRFDDGEGREAHQGRGEAVGSSCTGAGGGLAPCGRGVRGQELRQDGREVLPLRQEPPAFLLELHVLLQPLDGPRRKARLEDGNRDAVHQHLRLGILPARALLAFRIWLRLWIRRWRRWWPPVHAHVAGHARICGLRSVARRRARRKPGRSDNGGQGPDRTAGTGQAAATGLGSDRSKSRHQRSQRTQVRLGRNCACTHAQSRLHGVWWIGHHGCAWTRGSRGLFQQLQHARKREVHGGNPGQHRRAKEVGRRQNWKSRHKQRVHCGDHSGGRGRQVQASPVQGFSRNQGSFDQDRFLACKFTAGRGSALATASNGGCSDAGRAGA
eukprot:scaffold102_cov340-Pavlova_lutheri.AAC.56